MGFTVFIPYWHKFVEKKTDILSYVAVWLPDVLSTQQMNSNVDSYRY